MTIRRLLYSSAAVTVVVMVLLFGLLAHTSVQTKSALHRLRVASELSSEVPPLGMMLDGYLAQPDESNASRWQAQRAIIDEMVARESQSLSPLAADLAALDSAFAQLAAMEGQDEAQAQEIAAGIRLTIRDLLSQTAQIAAQTHDRLDVLENRGDILGTTLTLVIVLTIWLILYVLQRAVVRPLGTLAEGARRIGDGDLVHRFTQDRREAVNRYAETRELALAFNEMAERVETLVADLQDEAAARERMTGVLRASEEKYRSYIDHAPDGVFVADARGRYVEVNAAASAITGYSRDELLTMTISDLIPDDWQERAVAHFERLVREGKSTDTVLFLTKEGHRRYWEVAAVRLSDDRFLGFTKDVTAQVDAQMALQAQSEHLETLVGARTEELQQAQEQLLRREKLAALGQLSGSVGHELRGPLGVISNAVYYLRMVMESGDPTVSEYLGMIDAEVQTATAIITDLLDFGRVRAVDREAVAVSDLVSRVLLKYPAPAGIELRQVLAADVPAAEVPRLYVDARQIEQVVINLVTNAYQAMPEGGVLTLTTRTRASDGSRLGLLVSDTGQGIAAENLSKIFEPLYTTKKRGMGLGLAISRNLVEGNGGEIEVESEPGQGTTFTLWLPVA